jgi:hypothetical protein
MQIYSSEITGEPNAPIRMQSGEEQYSNGAKSGCMTAI